MVVTPKIGGAIDHTYGRRLFDNAHQPRISPGVPANGAGLFLGEVTTLRARMDPLDYRGENGCEPASLFRGLLEKMKGEPLRRLPADPREFGEFGDQLL